MTGYSFSGAVKHKGAFCNRAEQLALNLSLSLSLSPPLPAVSPLPVHHTINSSLLLRIANLTSFHSLVPPSLSLSPPPLSLCVGRLSCLPPPPSPSPPLQCQQALEGGVPVRAESARPCHQRVCLSRLVTLQSGQGREALKGLAEKKIISRSELAC